MLHGTLQILETPKKNCEVLIGSGALVLIWLHLVGSKVNMDNWEGSK